MFPAPPRPVEWRGLSLPPPPKNLPGPRERERDEEMLPTPPRPLERCRDKKEPGGRRGQRLRGSRYYCQCCRASPARAKIRLWMQGRLQGVTPVAGPMQTQGETAVCHTLFRQTRKSSDLWRWRGMVECGEWTTAHFAPDCRATRTIPPETKGMAGLRRRRDMLAKTPHARHFCTRILPGRTLHRCRQHSRWTD